MKLTVFDYTKLIFKKKVYGDIIDWHPEGPYLVLLDKRKYTIRIPLAGRVFHYSPEMYANINTELKSFIEKNKQSPFRIESKHIQGDCVFIGNDNSGVQQYLMNDNTFIESFVYFEEKYQKFDSTRKRMESEVGERIPISTY